MTGNHMRIFLMFNHYDYNFIYNIISSVNNFSMIQHDSLYRTFLSEEFECKSNLRRFYKKHI